LDEGHCERCLATYKRAQTRLYAARKQAGLCARCGGPADRPKGYCAKCYLVAKIRRDARRGAWRARGKAA
jgi:hypothetical protein